MNTVTPRSHWVPIERKGEWDSTDCEFVRVFLRGKQVFLVKLVIEQKNFHGSEGFSFDYYDPIIGLLKSPIVISFITENLEFL